MDGKHFDELLFQQAVIEAQNHVKKLLHTERTVALAADIQHQYIDKFSLSEFCTNLALSALQDVFTPLGLNMQEHGEKFRNWTTNGKSITLRLEAKEECTFLRQSSREVETGKTRVTESSFFGLIKSEKMSSVFSTIQDFYFSIRYHWKIVLYSGTDVKGGILLGGRTAELEVRCAHRDPPMPLTKNVPPIETCVGGMSHALHTSSLDVMLYLYSVLKEQSWWLFFVIVLACAYLAGLIGASSFFIDRADANCRTPRRNPDTQRVLDELHRLCNWSQAVVAYFTQQPLARETNMDWAPQFGTKPVKPIASLSVSDA